MTQKIKIQNISSHKVSLNKKIFLNKFNFKKLFSSKKIKNSDLSKKYFKEIILNGIGFKSFKHNGEIAFDLGYSNIIKFIPHKDVIIKDFKTKILIISHDKQLLTQTIATIKQFSKPDAYKGKGIILKNEKLNLKKKK